jgi:hypothetical protein
MTFDQWTKQVLVLCLQNEQATGEQHSDLEEVCKNGGILFNEEWAVRFINEQKQFGNGAGNNIVGYDFSLSLNGRYEARSIVEKNESKTLIGAIKAIPRSDWISVAAFVVSVIALWKS